MSAPAANEEVENAPAATEVEAVEDGASKKIKRGIYGGYGYGIGYPFGYSHYPYGGKIDHDYSTKTHNYMFEPPKSDRAIV